MFKFHKKKEEETTGDAPSNQPSWDQAASQALEQAVAQAPVPALLKNKMKKELKKAAEEHARQAGRTAVTPEDLMNGLLAKLPDNMRSRVDEAMKKGPDGLKDLENELKQ